MDCLGQHVRIQFVGLVDIPRGLSRRGPEAAGSRRLPSASTSSRHIPGPPGCRGESGRDRPWSPTAV